MNDELKVIKKASFVKRILAIIMDGSVAIFAFFAFFILVFSPIATHAFGYKNLVNEASDLQISSHLYIEATEKQNRNTPIYNIDNSESSFYTEKVRAYYSDFKVNLASDKDQEITDENGNKILPKDYYTEAWVNEKFPDTMEVKAAKQASYDALVDFSKYLSNYQMKIKRIELFMILPSYFISFGGFFILVPLLYKNGETFGKKIMGIGLVTKDGYDVKKRQIVMRQLFMLFLTTAVSFTFTIGTGSFIFLGMGVLIYYIAAFISKTNRSMSDYLAYTYMIDTKNSVWFKDKKEEEEKRKIVAENLEKYNKVKEENKNLIQVGSTIVNKEVEKEFLESKESEETKK